MADLEVEQLYLFEVLVDYINIYRDAPVTWVEDRQPPLNVKIKFINFPCIDIDDTECENKQDEIPEISCLFPSLSVLLQMVEHCRHRNQLSDESMVRVTAYCVKKMISKDISEKQHPSLEPLLSSDQTPRDSDYRKTNTTYSNEEGKWTKSKGKTILFPMAPLQLIKLLQTYPIAIYVDRSEESDKPFAKHHVVGHHREILPSDFCSLVLTAVNKDIMLPISTTSEDMYPLHNSYGSQIGSIRMYLRLSCFGSTVLLQDNVTRSLRSSFRYDVKDNNFRYQITQVRAQDLQRRAKDKLHIELPPVVPIITTEENVYFLDKMLTLEETALPGCSTYISGFCKTLLEFEELQEMLETKNKGNSTNESQNFKFNHS